MTMVMLPGEWYVCSQDHYLQIPPYLGGSVDIMVFVGGIYLNE
jgi:hypothetical protein